MREIDAVPIRVLDKVNAVDYGLTCPIWTNELSTAHRTSMAVQAGYIWINEVDRHFQCLEEMLRFTPEKNIHVKLRQGPG